MLDPFSVSLCAFSATLYNILILSLFDVKKATRCHMFTTFLQEKKDRFQGNSFNINKQLPRDKCYQFLLSLNVNEPFCIAIIFKI